MSTLRPGKLKNSVAVLVLCVASRLATLPRANLANFRLSANSSDCVTRNNWMPRKLGMTNRYVFFEMLIQIFLRENVV